MIVLVDVDPVHALHGNLAHFVGNGVVTVTGQTIDTGADQKMCAECLRFAKEFVNVVLPVAGLSVISCVGGRFNITPPWL
tara:strand:- start:1448 stop:1687 length:240 start_codon:yes stop_codon:yes gene_type:complete